MRPRPTERNFWRSLQPVARDALTRRSKARVFAAGDVLCREGDRTTDVFVIKSGWTKITTRIHGREHIVAVRGPGDVIGERARISGRRSATVTALNELSVQVIPAQQFTDILDDHPLARKIFERLDEERQAEDEARRGSLPRPTGTEPHVTAQLRSLVLRCAGDLGAGRATIVLPMSFEELADWADDEPEAVTGQLRAWRDLGIVPSDPAHAGVVIDVSRLQPASVGLMDWPAPSAGIGGTGRGLAPSPGPHVRKPAGGDAAYTARLEIVAGALPLRPGRPVTVTFTYLPGDPASGPPAGSPDVKMTVLVTSPHARINPGLRHTVLRYGEGTQPCVFVLTANAAPSRGPHGYGAAGHGAAGGQAGAEPTGRTDTRPPGRGHADPQLPDTGYPDTGYRDTGGGDIAARNTAPGGGYPDVELTISVYRTADSLLLQEFTTVLNAVPVASAERGR